MIFLSTWLCEMPLLMMRKVHSQALFIVVNTGNQWRGLMKIKAKWILIAGVVVLIAATGVAALVLNKSTGKKETDSKNVSISNAGSIIDNQVQTQTAGNLSGLENVEGVTSVQGTAGDSDIYNQNGGKGFDENGTQTGLDGNAGLDGNTGYGENASYGENAGDGINAASQGNSGNSTGEGNSGGNSLSGTGNNGAGNNSSGNGSGNANMGNTGNAGNQNSSNSGGSSSGGSAGIVDNGGSSNLDPSGGNGGLDSSSVGGILPGQGFSQVTSNVYAYEKDGQYYGEVVTQPDVTIIYIKQRSRDFDSHVQSVIASMIPDNPSTVWNTYVTANTDKTFVVDNKKVRVVAASNGGHSQIVIYN